MLMANVLAKIDRYRDELEKERKDLDRVNNLIRSLQDQKNEICRNISDLEYKIEELEDELYDRD